MLNPRKRITKKELKQDRLVTFYLEANDFLRYHQKTIFYWIIGVVAVSALAVILIGSEREAETKALSQLGKAELIYTQAQYDEAAKEFLTILNTHSGTRAAGIACFYLANCYYFMRDNDNARTYFQKYIDDFSDDPDIAASSCAGIAATLENNKKYDEAITHYRKAMDINPDGFLVPQYLIDVARCLRLQGNVEEAKTTYQRVMDNYKNTPFESQVEELMAQL